jgi:hypothetical protein
MDSINELNGDTKTFIVSDDNPTITITDANHKVIITDNGISINNDVVWTIAYELDSVLKDMWLTFNLGGALYITDIQKLRVRLPKERVEHVVLDKDVDTYEKFKVLMSTREFQNMLDKITI